MTGATGARLEELRNTALRFGETTRFTATQAAEGLLELARAGLSAQDSIKGLPATLNLATAGRLGLGEASDLATNVASQFGLAAEEISRVGDALAGVSTRTNTDVSQLGQALVSVGGVAANFGITLEDTVGVLGLLAQEGLKGSRAGRQLRQAFAQLADLTPEAREELERLGLSATDVSIRQQGLTGVLRALKGEFVGFEEAVKIVGVESAQALAVAAKRVDELADKTANLTGESQRLAEVSNQGLPRSLREASAATEALQLAIGDAGLSQALRTLIDLYAQLARATAGAFRNNTEQLRSVRDFVVPREVGISGPANGDVGGLLGIAPDALAQLRQEIAEQTRVTERANVTRSQLVDELERFAVAQGFLTQSQVDEDRRTQRVASSFQDIETVEIRPQRPFDLSATLTSVLGPIQQQIDLLQRSGFDRDAASLLSAANEPVTDDRLRIVSGRLRELGDAQQAEALKDTTRSLEQEAEALRRSGTEREAYIEAIRNGIDPSEQNIAVLQRNIEVLERLASRDRLINGIADGIFNIGVAADLAAGQTEQAAQRIIQAISNIALQELALTPLRNAFSALLSGAANFLPFGAGSRQGGPLVPGGGSTTFSGLRPGG